MPKRELTLFERFRRLKIDHASIGLAKLPAGSEYACTPKGAKLIGWAGVDGIHYCFIKGFGEMVFAVSPSAMPDEPVHPLADSFVDFLRLLISCGGPDAAEQAHNWDRAEFEAYLWENQPGETQQSILNTIREKLAITPMEDPFGYVKGLQDSFDCSRIPRRPGYRKILPAAPEETPGWAVYFEDGFFPRSRCRGAGAFVPLDARFTWNGAAFHVPAAYICPKGLVLDIFAQADNAKMAAFIEKWESMRDREAHIHGEERERLEAENPLNVEFDAAVTVNGREMRESHGYGQSWIAPELLPEDQENGWRTQELLEHYGLDTGCCWAARRISFPWSTGRRVQAKHVTLHLSARPTAIPGIHLHTPRAGETFSFVHPITGQEHTLTIHEYEAQEMPDKCFGSTEDTEYPTHYHAMSYSLSPDIPNGGFFLQDCAEGDRPRKKCPTPNGPSAVLSSGVIGIIARPTALPGNEGVHLRAACSALHFTPVEAVEWRITFHEKLTGDIGIQLL